jgi:hypothetical protein
MIKSRYGVAIMLCIAVFFSCDSIDKKSSNSFDALSRTVKVNNWQFDLNVENQNKKVGTPDANHSNHYLKATLDLYNVKTKKSLLYSLSDNAEDYAEKYKYLSFGSNRDLYIKYGDDYIYPIGYVFEPSNGLSKSERLVYKFQISDTVYKNLIKNNDAVEYWYIDRLVGLGKICFKQQ